MNTYVTVPWRRGRARTRFRAFLLQLREAKAAYILDGPFKWSRILADVSCNPSAEQGQAEGLQIRVCGPWTFSEAVL